MNKCKVPYLDADLIYAVNDSKKMDDTQLAISVCLSTYNFEDRVIRALKSALEQSYANYEIVISDDCSTDHTVEKIKAFLLKYKGPIRVRLYRGKENGGIVRNRLRGMNYADGDVFVQTDGDDFSMPHRIEAVAKKWQALERKPSILVTNALHYYEENSRIGGSVFPVDTQLDYPPADPVDGKISMFSAAFVIERELFETFKSVYVPKGLIADDPVFAKRSMLLKGMHVDLEPIFYYSTTIHSASGGGVSGRKWILDRYNRCCLLEQDIRAVRDITADESNRIARWKKRLLLDAKLIDCPNLVWPFYWIKMWFISGCEARAALKKRIKLIVLGSVDASFRKG